MISEVGICSQFALMNGVYEILKKIIINMVSLSLATDEYFERWKEAVRRCKNWHGESFLPGAGAGVS